LHAAIALLATNQQHKADSLESAFVLLVHSCS